MQDMWYTSHGNTQQQLKLRIKEHFTDVKNLVCSNFTSDSYAEYFALNFNKDKDIAAKKVKQINDVDILW